MTCWDAVPIISTTTVVLHVICCATQECMNTIATCQASHHSQGRLCLFADKAWHGVLAEECCFKHFMHMHECGLGPHTA